MMVPDPISVRVKVCCISSVEEAALAIRLGAAALGLVSHMPSGPGVIPEADIARISTSVPPAVSTFLLTSRTSPAEIVHQHHRCRTQVIQLCARVGADGLADLRHRLPGIKLVQVVHVTGAEAVDRACVVDALVDAVLLDSGRPHADRPELGGTGKVHDWSLSARIRDRLSSRVLLAGGLTEHNVQEAIRTVRPFGVDVCSGVRTDGGLDAGKLERFVRRVRASQAW